MNNLPQSRVSPPALPHRLVRQLVAAGIALSVGINTHAASQTWNSDGSSVNWSSVTNWGGVAAPGSGTVDNSDVATFNSAVGTVGTSGNPVLFDSAWKLGGIVFDTASAGPFYIGTTGGNAVSVATNSAITINSSVINTQTFNAPLAIRGTTGNFSLVNNSTNSSALLNVGGAVTAVAATGTTTLTLGGTNTGNNTFNGALGGGAGATMALTKSGAGTWVLTGAQAYTGTTTLRGGNLVLDYTAAGAPVSNIISASSTLTLGAVSAASSETLTINGKAGASTAQTFGNVLFVPSGTIGGGAGHINLNAGSGGSLSLALGTFSAKSGGASLDFTLSANSSVTTTTASAATGSASGLFANVVTINGTDFATNNNNAANALAGLSTISGAYATNTTVSANLVKALDIQGDTSITNNYTLPAIRFNQASAATLTIASGRTANLTGNGAILVTSNVGANTTMITGGTISGNARDLSLVQNNTAGRLQIDAAVSNYATNTTALAKSGQGLAVLAGTNTYTGVTFINEGTLQFAKQTSLYNNTTASWTAANINVASGATLALNVGGSGEFTTSDIATLSALGTATTGLTSGAKLGLDTSSGDFTHTTGIANTNGGANAVGLRKLGANTLTLTGAGTYTGGTAIEQGRLALTQNFSMGSASANSISIINAAGSSAGTDYAQLVFSGTTLTYGGSLSLSLTGTISTTTTYDLVDFLAGSGAGNFNSVSLTGSYLTTLTSSGSVWTGSSNGIDFSFSTITGDLTATVSSVPEPSSWAAILGGVALAGVLAKRRRNQRG